MEAKTKKNSVATLTPEIRAILKNIKTTEGRTFQFIVNNAIKFYYEANYGKN